MNGKTCIFLAAVMGFVSVLLGAFGAHGLKDTHFLENKYATTEAKNITGLSVPASYKYMQDFETGIKYHMTHALAMLATGLLILRQPSRSLSIAAWCFFGGIVLFSGALYIMVIGGPKWLGIPWGAFAPIGGTLQLIGWVALAFGALFLKESDATR